MDSENTNTMSLGLVPVGSHIRTIRSYWGDSFFSGEGDVIFEVMGHEPSKVYPSDGVVLNQISGPANTINAVDEDEDEDDAKYEENASPIHAVGLEENSDYPHYVAFVIVAKN